MKLMLTLFLGFLMASPLFAMTYRGCNSSQIKTIQAAHLNVKKRLSELLDKRTGIPSFTLPSVLHERVRPENRVPSSRFKNHNQTYVRFHSNVTQNLRKMISKIGSGYTYQCSSASVRHCKGSGGVQAYVLFLFGNPYNKIHFCPLYFKGTMNEMEETLLHELSHLAAKTDHYFGSIMNDEGMVASTNDAYLYGRMMHWSIEGLMKMSSWGFIWTPEK